MSEFARKIIEAAASKKPLDAEIATSDALAENAQNIVNDCEIVFVEYDEMMDDNGEPLDEEVALFFEEFHTEYGHLPEDDQLEIMANMEAELQAEMDAIEDEEGDE